MSKEEHVHACPFCGGTSLLMHAASQIDDEYMDYNDEDSARVECDCGAHGPSSCDADTNEAIMGALASWNTTNQRRPRALNDEGIRCCPFCEGTEATLSAFDDFWWEICCPCGARAISSGDQNDTSDEAAERHKADLRKLWNQPVGLRALTTLILP